MAGEVIDLVAVEVAPLARDFGKDLGRQLKGQTAQIRRAVGQPLDAATDQASREAGADGAERLGTSFQGGMKGQSSKLRRSLTTPMRQAGDKAGEEGGDEAADSFGSGFAAKMKGAGKAKLLAGGAAAGAAITAGVAGAMNVEVANDRLAAQLGLTAPEAKRIGGVAGSLYADAYGENLGEVNEAVRSVIQNVEDLSTGSTADLERVSGKALNLAKVFDEDLNNATQAAGQILRTGLADNADEAFDILTRGFQTGANRSQDLLDTFVEYPALFERLGLAGEDAMGLISQGMQAGARNSDLVADALKEFQIRATDASDQSAEGFKMLGLNAGTMTEQIAQGGEQARAGLDTVLDALRNTEDPVKRNAAAVALFGTQAEDLGGALFALDPSSAVGALGEVEGAAGRMGDTMRDNASTNITSFGRQAKQVFVGIVGGAVLPALSKAASFLASQFGPAVQRVGEFIRSEVVPALRQLWTWIQTNILPSLQALASWIQANVLPVLKSVAQWIGGVLVGAFRTWGTFIRRNIDWLLPLAGIILGIVAAVKAWTIATRILGAVMRMTPLGIVITLLGVLVTALIYAWQNSETFRNIVTSVWQGVVSVVKWAWNTIIKPIFNFIVAYYKMLWTIAQQMVKFVVAAWQLLSRALSSAWGWIKRNVIDRLIAGWRLVQQFTTMLKNNVVSRFDQLRSALGAAARWINTHVVQPIRRFFQSVWDKAGEIRRGVINTFGRMRDSIGSIFSSIVDKIKGPIRSVLGFINKWIIDKVNVVTKPFGFTIPSINTNFNKGGLVPGTGNKDTVAAMLTPREGVVTAPRMAEIASQAGMTPSQAIKSINNGTLNPATMAAAASGKPVDVNPNLGVGGWFDDFSLDSLGNAWDALKDTGNLPGWAEGAADAAGMGAKFLMEKAMNAAVDFFEGRFTSPALVSDFIGGTVKWMRNKLIEWGSDADAKADSSGVGVAKAGGALGKGPLFPGGWRRPLSGYRISRGSAGHGYNSIDLAAAMGTPVGAAHAGTIASIQRLATSYGHHIRINHGGGLSSLYAHLSQISASIGQRVVAGSRIGAVGSTGNSTGPHLHFEILKNGARQEPTNYIRFDAKNGGTIPRGYSTVYNGTGGPERLKPAEAGDGLTVVVNVPGGFIGNQRDFQDMMVRTLTDLDRKGRLNGIRTMANAGGRR